jgi:hypothetical protein
MWNRRRPDPLEVVAQAAATLPPLLLRRLRQDLPAVLLESLNRRATQSGLAAGRSPGAL